VNATALEDCVALDADDDVSPDVARLPPLDDYEREAPEAPADDGRIVALISSLVLDSASRAVDGEE
jgi:hypothetical protein